MVNIKQIVAIVIALVVLPPVSEAKREHLIRGRTMGTTYNITVVAEDNRGVAGLKEKIDARLVEINNSMSTYQKSSEISRFNKLELTDQPFEISADFYRVMRIARAIFELSGGAWDGTVNPLVDLWGFGRAGRQSTLPDEGKIAALLPRIGFDKIRIFNNHTLVKKSRAITIDLSSIAKGFGVDEVAQIINKTGYGDYLVEIGGEIYASGRRQDGKLWRVGINRPRKDAAFDAVYKIVDLNNQAFATSGDYRNFFEIDGIRYSHIIDPRTGYPVSNGVVSVSVVAANCALADGLATAVMVMGTDDGLALINRLESVESLIVMEKANGSLVTYYSKGFEVVP